MLGSYILIEYIHESLKYTVWESQITSSFYFYTLYSVQHFTLDEMCFSPLLRYIMRQYVLLH